MDISSIQRSLGAELLLSDVHEVRYSCFPMVTYLMWAKRCKWTMLFIIVIIGIVVSIFSTRLLLSLHRSGGKKTNESVATFYARRCDACSRIVAFLRVN